MTICCFPLFKNSRTYISAVGNWKSVCLVWFRNVVVGLVDDGRGCVTKFYTGRLRREVQPLACTLLYTIFDKKKYTLSYTFYWQTVHAWFRTLHSSGTDVTYEILTSPSNSLIKYSPILACNTSGWSKRRGLARVTGTARTWSEIRCRTLQQLELPLFSE